MTYEKPQYQVNISHADEAASIGDEPTQRDVTTTVAAPTASTANDDAVATMLLQAGSVGEMARFLAQFKTKGRINDYQAARSLQSVPADSYKIIIDRETNIVRAIISPAGINIATYIADDMLSYHGCSIVWYK